MVLLSAPALSRAEAGATVKVQGFLFAGGEVQGNPEHAEATVFLLPEKNRTGGRSGAVARGLSREPRLCLWLVAFDEFLAEGLYFARFWASHIVTMTYSIWLAGRAPPLSRPAAPTPPCPPGTGRGEPRGRAKPGP